jgi:hypothetical protein
MWPRVWPGERKKARSGMCLKTAVACSLLCSWLLPTVVVANVVPHSSGGQLVAEPMGVAEIAIVRKTLAIDLRPLDALPLCAVQFFSPAYALWRGAFTGSYDVP